MKKIMNFLKRNTKVVVAFAIGIAISGVGVYAATSTTLFASSVVGFDNSTASLTLDNKTVDNVQDALDALYAKSNSEGCPSGYTMYDQSSSGYSCAKQVTITLNPNGGTVTPTTLSLTSLSTTYGAGGSLPTPTAGGTVAGYNFAGWYTAETGGTKVTDSTTFTYGTSTTTLYAHWSKGGVDDLISGYTSGSTTGLVAVKSDGTLYTGSGTIREYRYSGGETEVNNWIKFNGENWRIIGLFDEDGDGQYGMRIIREEALPTSTPTSYSTTVSGSSASFTIRYSSSNRSVGAGAHSSVQPSYTAANIYWNNGGPRSGYNDWAKAGLQFYLNEESNTNSWYYNNFKKSGASGVSYEQYIATSTWYLRTVTVDSSGYVSGTPATVYTQEHSSGSVYSGNATTWSGKVGLLYASDYGYAGNYSTTSSWGSQVGYYYNLSNIKTKNWILRSSDTSGYFWMLSPSSNSSSDALRWRFGGDVSYSLVSGYSFGVRPVLNLTSDTPIVSGTGAYNDPYKIIS